MKQRAAEKHAPALGRIEVPSSIAFVLIMVATALAVVGGAIWMQLRVPSQLRAVLSANGADGADSADSADELTEAHVAALTRYVQRCSSLSCYDLPLERIRGLTDTQKRQWKVPDGSRSGYSGGGCVDSAWLAKGEASRLSLRSQKVEADLAREAHRMVLEENGGEWTSKLHRLRIDRIVNMLSYVAGGDPESYKLTMVNSPRINAFSTADGRIYLTRGLITTSSDDEIALVLAHEMHHIRSGHWINWWALSAGNGGVFGAEAEGPQYAGPMVQAVDALVEAGVDALAGEASTSYGQEYEADASGMLHAAECGYSEDRIFRILTRLPMMPVTSHPTSSERIVGASKVIEAMDDPTWIAAHNPSGVARRALEDAIAAARGDRPGIYVTIPGLDEVAAVCAGVLEMLENLETELRTCNWAGSSWPYGDDSRIVVRTVLVSPVLSAVNVGVETTLRHSSAGTPGVLGGRLWLVRRGGVWVVALGQQLPGMRPISPEWSLVGDELGSAWRRVGRKAWLSGIGNTGPEVWNRNGDIAAARGALKAAARWRDTSVKNFEEHLSTYASGRIECVRNADEWQDVEDDSAGAHVRHGLKRNSHSMGSEANAKDRNSWNGACEDGSLEAIGWAQFLGGREAECRAWNVRCDVHSDTLATVTFSSAVSLENVPITSNFTRLTMVREDGQWKAASVSLQ